MQTRHGSFVWFEIHTPTPDATRAFLAELIGYDTGEMKLGDDRYRLLLVGDRPVAGVVPAEGEARFVSYVSVKDVDAAAKRVKKAGGKTLGDAFDVPTIGRMQAIADADGASCFLFASAGDDEPPAQGRGAFLWNELWAKDDVRALSFATAVLGYQAETMDFGGAPYHVLKTTQGPVAGIMRSPVPGLAPHWLPYVHVDDVDATLDRARALGATIEGPAIDAPGIGRFATLRAPDGARFAVMTPAAN